MPTFHYEWRISVAKQWKGKFCYTKALRELIFPFAVAYTEIGVPIQPVHSSESQGTKDGSGHVLAMSLRPFVGSDELIFGLACYSL